MKNEITYTYSLDGILDTVCEHLDEVYEFPQGTFAQEGFTRDTLKTWIETEFEQVLEDAVDTLTEQQSNLGEALARRRFQEAIAKHLPYHKGA